MSFGVGNEREKENDFFIIEQIFKNVPFLVHTGSNGAPAADQYLDSVIGEPLERSIQDMGLDPAPLPDFWIPFQFGMGPVPVNGRFDFHNGIFNGLSRIRRFSECEGPTISLNEVGMECVMSFFGMSTVYDGKARIEQLPPMPFQVTAYVNETLAKSGISGAPASLKGNLKVFEITKFGDINARPSNLGPMQYFYNAVEEEFRDEIRKELTRIILTQFPTAFRMALTQARLPGMG
ncbi:uncharacterized protein LOC129216323 [Uloborus diversus]|uniref:uncharacterized protein LOC129216323 n=1 Tax=Uloborus diversus TaxID=327109 RepID=UPI0024091A47|nr:uncharacterized protein LOC129216323 [Uloborus diversus]